MDDINAIIFIINPIVTIICSINIIYANLILNRCVNGLLMHTLDTKISNGYILNTNKIIASIIIHYDESNTNICRMNYFDVIMTYNKRN